MHNTRARTTHNPSPDTFFINISYCLSLYTLFFSSRGCCCWHTKTTVKWRIDKKEEDDQGEWARELLLCVSLTSQKQLQVTTTHTGSSLRNLGVVLYSRCVWVGKKPLRNKTIPENGDGPEIYNTWHNIPILRISSFSLFESQRLYVVLRLYFFLNGHRVLEKTCTYDGGYYIQSYNYITHLKSSFKREVPASNPPSSSDGEQF